MTNASLSRSPIDRNSSMCGFDANELDIWKPLPIGSNKLARGTQDKDPQAIGDSMGTELDE